MSRARRGRGTKKVPVVALVERVGSVRAFPVERVNAKTPKKVVRENVHPSSMILADEWARVSGAREGVQGWPLSVNHGAGEYWRGGAGTNTVESYFSLLKTGVYGSFHHVSKRHLRRYCDEFSFRWNYRKATDGERTDPAIRGAEGKRLTYRTRVRR